MDFGSWSTNFWSACQLGYGTTGSQTVEKALCCILPSFSFFLQVSRMVLLTLQATHQLLSHELISYRDIFTDTPKGEDTNLLNVSHSYQIGYQD